MKMTSKGIEAFDSTLQKTHVWLKEIMDELGTEDRHEAYLALRSTLQALRDRLTVQEATDLGAQLPMLVRGFYYEGWNPVGKPVKDRTKEEFLERVKESWRPAPEEDVDVEPAARAVFKVLSKHVTEGEIEDVKRSLPEKIRELWE